MMPKKPYATKRNLESVRFLTNVGFGPLGRAMVLLVNRRLPIRNLHGESELFACAAAARAGRGYQAIRRQGWEGVLPPKL